MKTVSFVIPCYRSGETVPIVVKSIVELFSEQKKYDYRILLCNDGSPDNVWERIRELCEKNKKIIGVTLTRNFGQQAARMALLPYVTGDYVVFTDDDGQHPLEYVFPMISKLEEGYDAVYADFSAKKHSLMQRLGSRVNSWMMEKYLGKPKGIKISSFFVLRRFVADEIKRYATPQPYINGYVLQVTRSITNLPMPHKPRIAGKSGYSFKKLLKLWLTGFTSFSSAPLHTCAVIGGVIAFAGFIFGLVIIIQKLLNPAMAMGYASTMAGMLFLGGVIMLMLGLVGEYIGHMFMRVNNLPQYVVREHINDKDDSGGETEISSDKK